MPTNAKGLQREFWVGALFMTVVVLLVIFGWLMGAIGPLQRHLKIFVLYNFAGGIEVGSPVRVSGVKVGKVSKIEFLPSAVESHNDSASLKITMDVSMNAAPIVREDSKFYVNMAGIIGEKYIEISPGTSVSPTLHTGATVRGVDPPRIDQFLGGMKELIADANKILKGRERQKITGLIENLNAVTGDLHEISSRLKNPETIKFYDEIYELVHRAHAIDKPTLQKFLQEDGIRARVF